MKKSSNILINKRVRIISDNELYDPYRKEVLIITHASNEGVGYDSGMYPEFLCSFEIEGKPTKEFPFSLYEYEFNIIE